MEVKCYIELVVVFPVLHLRFDNINYVYSLIVGNKAIKIN